MPIKINSVKSIRALFFLLILALLANGCQAIPSEPTILPLPAETQSFTPPTPTDTVTPSPTVKPYLGSRIVSIEKLNCTPAETFVKCVDETLKIQFEHPLSWGGLAGVLRTGWDNGYAYQYYFVDADLPEQFLPGTGGLSRDFLEGRERYSLDFYGFETAYSDSCEQQDLYPICEIVNPNVKWMIRFPNATYFCEYTFEETSPLFRIEVNLPENPTINGFVFEVPFLSDALLAEVKEEIYPLLLSEVRHDPSFEPLFIPSFETCKHENRQPFDDQVYKFIERLQNKSLDRVTLKNMDELIHMAQSIMFK